MMTKDRGCVGGVELRGQIYYLRMRVPARYRDVEARREVNQSLKTRDYDEARLRYHVRRKAYMMDWDRKLAELAMVDRRVERDPAAYDLAMELLSDVGVPYRPMDDLLEGPIRDLLDRIEAAAKHESTAPHVSALLGGLEYPRILMSEMPEVIEGLNAAGLTAKNPRQLREWRGKYSHAARSFAEVIGDKPVLEVSESDAVAYRRHWIGRVDAGEIRAHHAGKRLRFVRQLIDAYFERFDIAPSQRRNPFMDMKIDGAVAALDESAKKVALPVSWVKRVIIDQEGLDGLNAEARDIAIVAAECGCRQSEIYDLPAMDIRLDDEIPHIILRRVDDVQHKRELKNGASARPIALLGAALEAMLRNPQGFPRYRGKGNYSGSVNKYFRERGLFPEMPPGQVGKYTIGCTRHTFEDRMFRAKMTNEERAYLMGHSIGRLRGRPEYGSGPDLRMRQIYQEMVSYPISSWIPRPISALRDELDLIAEEMGFRVR